MKSVIAVFLIISPLLLLGQNQQEVDSITTLLHSESDQVESGFLLLELSELYINTKRDKSDSLALRALELARKNGRTKLLTESLSLLGYINYKDEKDNISLAYYKELDSILEINNLKNELLIKSKLYQSQIAKFTYTDQGMLRAKDYLDEMLELAKEIKSSRFEHLAYLSIGQWYAVYAQAYDKEKNLNKAITNYEKALNHFKEQNDISNISKTYWSLSSAVRKKGGFRRAEDFLEKRISLLRDSKDTLELANAHNALATFQYRYTKNYNLALQNYEYALTIYKKKGYQNANYKLDILNGMAFTHTKLSDYKMGFKYLDQAYLLKDSLDRNRSRKATIELETKYQTEKKEQEIALLTSQNELVEQQKKNQRNLLLGGISLTSLAGIFFFFLYRNRQKTTRKLKEIDNLKSNFFANISHEFRTPLTLISAPLEKRLEAPKLSNDDRSDFEMMRRNSHRLLNLVDQLLGLSKLESGHLKLKVTQGDLQPLLKSITSSFQHLAKEKNIKYSVKVKNSRDVWFDKNVMEKTVINLLSNAFKYTPNNGSINFETIVKNGYLEIRVENSGSTLSKEKIDQIFNRFYQADEAADGVGIGLSLVKELVTLSHGSIEVENTQDNTIVFKVTLPVLETAFDKDELAIEAEADSTSLPYQQPVITTSKTNLTDDVILDEDQPILLIVEDNADVREFVKSTFSDSYQILEAENGKIGVEKAIEFVPDIIISDIMMPETNGLELCKQLKLDERTSHIPIILLTAKAGEEDEYQGLETGADDYITKPFKIKLVETRVQNLVTSRKLLRDRYSQEVVLKPKDIAITNLDEQFLERVQNVLDKKLTESSFSTEEFSKAVGMSRMQLHRKLKALTDLSASEFIRSQRLKLAASLLQKSDANISEIGYTVGFNDHAYFSKCFKEAYGCSPSEYTSK